MACSSAASIALRLPWRREEMMPDLGEHAAFIWSAYLAVAIVLAILVGWVVVDGRRQRALLERLDAKASRRSDGESGP